MEVPGQLTGAGSLHLNCELRVVRLGSRHLHPLNHLTGLDDFLNAVIIAVQRYTIAHFWFLKKTAGFEVPRIPASCLTQTSCLWLHQPSLHCPPGDISCGNEVTGWVQNATEGHPLGRKRSSRLEPGGKRLSTQPSRAQLSTGLGALRTQLPPSPRASSSHLPSLF